MSVRTLARARGREGGREGERERMKERAFSHRAGSTARRKDGGAAGGMPVFEPAPPRAQSPHRDWRSVLLTHGHRLVRPRSWGFWGVGRRRSRISWWTCSCRRAWRGSAFSSSWRPSARPTCWRRPSTRRASQPSPSTAIAPSPSVSRHACPHFQPNPTFACAPRLVQAASNSHIPCAREMQWRGHAEFSRPPGTRGYYRLL